MNEAIYQSPVGAIQLVSEGDALAGVYWPQHKPAPRLPSLEKTLTPVLAEAMRQLDRYFKSALKTFDLPLAPHGTPFQLEVWRALQAIPFGETTSYGALAKTLGQPTAMRAVAGANARNPLSIFVPCHRVIAADGSVHGYAGGLEVKRFLLRLETARFSDVVSVSEPVHERLLHRA